MSRMKRRYIAFELYHPVLLLIYAGMAPVSVMAAGHPLYVGINLCMALVIHCFYFGASQTWKLVAYMSLCVLVVGLMNFCFNTRGMHVLFRIGQHLFTLESLLYGLTMGGVLAAVILWFQCLHKILSNEKFLYLFGKRLPGTALLVSMILKLFPDTRYRMECIRYADTKVMDGGSAPVMDRIKKGLRQLSVLMEWSMEDSIEKADSMKARGYGEGPRSSWQLYMWSTEDTVMGILMAAVVAVGLAGIIFYSRGFRWFPMIQAKGKGGLLAVSAICYAGFLALPLLAEWKVRWSRQWLWK